MPESIYERSSAGIRVSEIRELLRRQPFRPVAVHLADGRPFPVDHVDVLLISRNERTIIVAGMDGGYDVIDPIMVTSLCVSEGQTAT
jgi:hypothetical protein